VGIVAKEYAASRVFTPELNGVNGYYRRLLCSGLCRHHTGLLDGWADINSYCDS
jgi:hypothetical protein